MNTIILMIYPEYQFLLESISEASTFGRLSILDFPPIVHSTRYESFYSCKVSSDVPSFIWVFRLYSPVNLAKDLSILWSFLHFVPLILSIVFLFCFFSLHSHFYCVLPSVCFSVSVPIFFKCLKVKSHRLLIYLFFLSICAINFSLSTASIAFHKFRYIVFAEILSIFFILVLCIYIT